MYQYILVPIDGSKTSERAVTEASAFAKLCAARVRLLHIVDMGEHVYGYQTPHSYLSQTRPQVLAAARQLLQRTRSELEAQGILVDTELCESTGAHVSDIIVEHAVDCGADLIVLGTHGRRGIDRILMGSDAERVARVSPLPVLLITPANTKRAAHTSGMRTLDSNDMQDAV